MQITTVTYSRLRAGPTSTLTKYENERLELTSTVDEDEDVRTVYGQLRELVRQMLLTP